MTQILCWEGLSPWLIGTPSYIRDGLLWPHLREHGGENVQIWRGGFMSSGPIRDWDCDKVILIGHSMGAASAIAWCNRKAPKIQVDLLLTFDPRPLHRPYIKPANVKRAVNIYQCGWWMRGFEVQGAENYVVTCGHTQVPAHELAWKALREAL